MCLIQHGHQLEWEQAVWNTEVANYKAQMLISRRTGQGVKSWETWWNTGLVLAEVLWCFESQTGLWTLILREVKISAVLGVYLSVLGNCSCLSFGNVWNCRNPRHSMGAKSLVCVTSFFSAFGTELHNFNLSMMYSHENLRVFFCLFVFLDRSVLRGYWPFYLMLPSRIIWK